MSEVASEILQGQFDVYGLPQPENVPAAEVKRLLRIGQDIIDVFLSDKENKGGWTEDTRRALGRIVYEPFVRGRSRIEAIVRLSHMWATSSLHKGMSHALWTIVGPYGIREYCIDMGRWFGNAFPKIEIDPKFAATLMATKLTPEVLDDVVTPWSDFIIDTKGSPLSYLTKNEVRFRVDHIFVSAFKHEGQQTWNTSLFSGEWEMFRSLNIPTADLIGPEAQAMERFEDSAGTMPDEPDEADPRFRDSMLSGFDPMERARVLRVNARAMVLAQRLVIGACLSMSDPHTFRERQRTRERASPFKPKYLRGLPLVHVFELGRPVKIDCWDAMDAFCTGDAKRMRNVQWPVRGHWRNQACGPNFSLRKPVQIEPYWKGPEDAPILVRPHKLAP